MSICDVYIGRLDDPGFSHDGGNPAGNVPRRLSPFFPPTLGPGYGAWSELHGRIEAGLLNGRQTDWSGWVVPASKAEIEAFVDDLYSGNPVYSDGSLLPHLAEQLIELREFISGMEDDGQYALVATET
jgi:hypothetical protein